ncbi:MAG: hypothetical protein FJX76_13440 [Armatimonadetes bacterium]|nr:hypothetical protein [Armatimonadota bacterium]
MIISPRSTPEVPHRSTPLPAPLGASSDSVCLGLHVPDPTVGYRPFAPPDTTWTRMPPNDPTWTEGGPADDKRGVPLSNGGTRFGGPHNGRIEGLKIDGQPVMYHWRDHNYFWMLDLDDVVDNLLLAGDEAKEQVGKGTVTGRGGERIRYRELEAEDGTRRLEIALPGDRVLHVTSKAPLGEQAIDTLCSAFAECPPVALRGLRDVFVVESLGEKIDDAGNGCAHPLSAITRAGIPDITFVHERLRDPETGRHVVLHEVGHLVDGQDSVGSVSAVQRDASDAPLFGGGGGIAPEHEFNLASDAFVSHYGSLSPKEDFAEMHAVLLRQRTDFNIANPGHDLLTEPPQVASAHLSPRLGLKAEAVVERYRQLGHEAPAEGWLTKLRRRIGI